MQASSVSGGEDDEEPGVDQKHPGCDNHSDYILHILQSSGQDTFLITNLIISREKGLNWTTLHCTLRLVS